MVSPKSSRPTGGRDARSDAAQNQLRIAETVEADAGPEVTTRVFATADHMVLEWPLGAGVPPPRWPEGYRQLLGRWIRREAARQLSQPIAVR